MEMLLQDSDPDSEEEEEDEEDDEPADCKGLLSDVMRKLEEKGVDTVALWDEITRIVRLTLAAIHPDLALSYATCFQKADATDHFIEKEIAKAKSRRRSEEAKDARNSPLPPEKVCHHPYPNGSNVLPACPAST